MGNRLLIKFTLIYLFILAVSFITMGLLIEHQVRQGMTEKITKDLLSEGRLISNLPVGDILKHLSDLTRVSKARLTIVDQTGAVIGDSAGQTGTFDNHLNRPEIQASRLKGQGISIRYSSTLKADMLYIALPVKGTDQQTMAYVRLSRPLVEVEKVAVHFWRSLLLSVFPVLVLSLLLAFVFVVKIIIPVRKMAAFTEEVADGKRRGTLRIDSHDEIGRLAKNINHMVTELEERISLATGEKGMLTAAFDSMMEGLIVLDGRYRVEEANRALVDMMGNRYAEVKGKTLLEAFRNAELHQALERFKATGKTILQEITISGNPDRIMEVNLSAIRGLPKDEHKTILVFHEVTALKQLEKMRIDFVANVSHEIKTPLTNIIGFVETLEEGGIEDRETSRRFLRTIRDNALRLNRLVNDLLTLSNIELGKEKLHIEDVNLPETLTNILTMTEARAEEKRLNLVRNIPGNLSLIRADRDRLSQVLINILDNAVKYTPDGGTITIDTAREGREVMIRVTDTGIGIPRNEIPKLGQRFYRVDKTRSRQLGGTGLGLSIVKHLMAAHGGRMQIESTPGKGTSVSLYFPSWD
jgi:two-component system phosphate regulon sensor histidine kinase PhoR